MAEEETALTVGAIPSITSAFSAPRDPEEPGTGNVRVAAFPDRSFMVPPFKASDAVLS